MAWVECKRPECDFADCEGGDFGGDAWCPVCGTVYETDWDYTDAMEGSIAAWITREKGTMTAEQWRRTEGEP